MLLGRSNGAKGIYKVFCFDCNDYFYVSVTGKEKEDYMFQAADELTGNGKVEIIIDDIRHGNDYEYYNDYESCGIIKRISSSDERRHTFVKGENYHAYMKKLFPISVIASNPSYCPFCGSIKLSYSNVSATKEHFYEETVLGKECINEIHELTKQRIMGIVTEAETVMTCPLIHMTNKDICSHVNHLVAVERMILVCIIRYFTIHRAFVLAQRMLLHNLIESKRPNREMVPDMPEKPVISICDFFKYRSWNKKREAYRDAVEITHNARNMYEEMENDFRNLAVEYYNEASAKISEGNMEQFCQSVPLLTRKYQTMMDDLHECEDCMIMLIEMRKRLRITKIIPSKYMRSLHALVLLEEYLNSAECDEQAEESSLYNAFESKHSLDTLTDDWDIIWAVISHEYEKICLSLQHEIRTISSDADKLVEIINKFSSVENDNGFFSLFFDYKCYEKAFYSKIGSTCKTIKEYYSCE